MKYQFLDSADTDDVWFCLHGATDHRRFPNDCRMHELASTVYPVAPKFFGFRFGWLDRHKMALLELVLEVIEQRRERGAQVILAGHSNGTTHLHAYANYLQLAGLNIRCVVHYAGFFNPPRATCPGLGVVNEREPLDRMIDETFEMGQAYGGSVLTLDANGHRWAHEHNHRIREAALAS